MADSAANVTSTFTLNLQAKGVQDVAEGRKQLEEMRKSITGTSSNLKEMQTALRLLKGGGDQTREAQAKLKSEIAAQRSILATTSQSYREAGGKLSEVTRRQESWTAALEKASPKLGGLLSKVRAIPPGTVLLASGAVAAAATIAALTVAATAGVASLVSYGIAQADARRSEALRLQGLTQIRNFWTGWGPVAGNGAATAASLQSAIDDVTGTVALSREQVTGYAGDLYRMGLRGQNLRLTLQGMATTAAVNGEAQARAFAGMAAGANMTGQSVKALSDDVKARLGGISKAQLLSLDTQAQKFSANMGMLFKDLKIDALLEALGAITHMTSGSSYLGAALHRVVQNGVQPIVDGLAKGIPIARDFFFGLATGVVKVVIRLLDLAIWIKKLAREWGIMGKAGFDALKLGERAGKVLAIVFGAGLVASVAAIGAGLTAIAAVMGVVAAAAAIMIAPFYGAIKAGGILVRALISAWDTVRLKGWEQLGADIVHGIINGIKSAAIGLVNTVMGLGKMAENAFRKATDSHSPSRLFAKIGFSLPQGATIGVKMGAPDFTKAAADMLSLRALPPVASAAPASAQPALNGGSSGAKVTIGDIHIHVGGGSDAKGIGLEVRRQLEAILSGANAEISGRKAA